MRTTKKDMVQDIFFAATCGMRTKDNFVDGQILMEEIAINNYRWAIESWLNDYINDVKSAKQVLNEMVYQTIRNTYDRNCRPTAKSKRIEQAYYLNFRR